MRKIGSLFLLLALGACSSDGKPGVPPEPPAPEETEVSTANLICPQVAILRQAQETFDYGGSGPHADELVFKAKLKTLQGDCAYRNDTDDLTGIDIAFELRALAQKGPRLGGDKVGAPYFIAVVDPSDKVLSREVVTAHFEFSDDTSVTELTEPLHVFIPLSPAQLRAGPDYRVLVGFLKR